MNEAHTLHDVTRPSPPYNTELEQNVLGGLLAENLAYERIQGDLKPEHFYDQVHGRIFAAIETILAKKQVASAITLKNLFEHDGDLEEVGGAQYLAKLQAGAFAVVDIKDHSETLIDLATRRAILDLLNDFSFDAARFDLDRRADDVLSELTARLGRIGEQGPQPDAIHKIGDYAREVMENARAVSEGRVDASGLSTGLRDLDAALGCLHRGEQTVIAARPSMGKTALALTIARNVARADLDNTANAGPVLLFSFEMSGPQLGMRHLASQALVELPRIRIGKLNPIELNKMQEETEQAAFLPLHIVASANLTVPKMHMMARRFKRRHGLVLLLVDYLQLVPGERAYYGNRTQEVTENSRLLKLMAEDLDVPLITLSQLSRQVEQREDKRPQLSDLRESGAIEQDADVVIFLYREHYYLERTQPKKGEEHTHHKRLFDLEDKAEIIIAKQRQGPLSTVHARWNAKSVTFMNGDLPQEEMAL